MSLKTWMAALRVSREMLHQRQYEEIEDCLSPAQLASLLAEAGGGGELALAYRAKGNPRPNTDNEATIFFALHEKRVGIKTIRTLDSRSDVNGQLIIVSESGATPFVRKDLDISIFSLPQLCVNVTSHTLVPKHRHIWGEEVAGIDIASLPCLPTTDAVAAFLGFTPGEVILIERASRGNGVPGVTYFRRVVSA